MLGYDELLTQFNFVQRVRECAFADTKAQNNKINDNDSVALFCGPGGEVVLLSEYVYAHPCSPEPSNCDPSDPLLTPPPLPPFHYAQLLGWLDELKRVPRPRVKRICQRMG